MKNLYEELKQSGIKFKHSYEKAKQAGNLQKARSLREELTKKVDFFKMEVERLSQKALKSRINNFLLSNCNHSKKKHVEETILTFVWKLSKQIKLNQVILFGSQASGLAHEWSDIDLCIISPDFKRLSTPSRRNIFLEVVLKAGTPEIQAIGFTERELGKSKPIILNEIRKGKYLFHR